MSWMKVGIDQLKVRLEEFVKNLKKGRSILNW